MKRTKISADENNIGNSHLPLYSHYLHEKLEFLRLAIALNIEEVSDNYTHAPHSKYMTDSAPEKKLPDPGTTA